MGWSKPKRRGSLLSVKPTGVSHHSGTCDTSISLQSLEARDTKAGILEDIQKWSKSASPNLIGKHFYGLNHLENFCLLTVSSFPEFEPSKVSQSSIGIPISVISQQTWGLNFHGYSRYSHKSLRVTSASTHTSRWWENPMVKSHKSP